MDFGKRGYDLAGGAYRTIAAGGRSGVISTALVFALRQLHRMRQAAHKKTLKDSYRLAFRELSSKIAKGRSVNRPFECRKGFEPFALTLLSYYFLF